MDLVHESRDRLQLTSSKGSSAGAAAERGGHALLVGDLPPSIALQRFEPALSHQLRQPRHQQFL